MRRILALLGMLLAAPASANVDSATPEYRLAACIHQRDARLLTEIRDAKTQEEFVDALKRGAELCKTSDLNGFSMGRFFDAIAELIGKPTYEDEK